MRHPSYSRTQVLWLLWIILPCTTLAIAGAALALSGQAEPHDWVLLGLALAGQLIALGAFGRFTVEVGEGRIEWRFGWFGRPRWRLPLRDVESAEPVRAKAAEGWGIRKTPEGMLYNASGDGAVRLRCRDGTSLRLGSDEPERLAAFIRARVGSG